VKIAILSANRNLYSTRRLVEAGVERGHEMPVYDHKRCYMNIKSAEPEIHYNGKPVEGVDAIIPRIGASISFYGTAVVRQFEMMGVYSVNESVAITRSRDKLRALQLLSRKGIGLPKTGFANAPGDTDDLLELVGGAPVVIKLLEGTQGVGVVLAETKKAAGSVVEAFRGLKANFMVQEFIKEADGADIRCLVVGDKVVASMMRKAKEGEFRSNLHRGGSAQDRGAFGKDYGTQCCRRRSASIGSRASGDGSQFQPGTRGYREGNGKERRRHDRRVHREECSPWPNSDPWPWLIF
jgi:ribosomal protein S6--L-glutamate ligase